MVGLSALLIGASCTAADALSLLAPNPAPGPYWSGKNGDLLRTGASPFTVPSSLEGGPTWSFNEEGNSLVRAAPVIDAERNIYLATIPGSVYKFTPEGRQLWYFKVKESLQNGTASIPEVPALYNGVLYVTTEAANVIALSAETGKLLWQRRVGLKSAGDTWSMTAGDGVVVTATSDDLGRTNNRLVGLNAETGERLWDYKPDKIVYNVLCAIKDGSLVFSDFSGAPYRLNLHDGSVVWKHGPSNNATQMADFSTGGAVIGPNNVVYVTSNEKTETGAHGRVTAFSFEDGTLLWRADTDYQANNAAAVGTLSSGGALAVVVGVGENPDMPDLGLQLRGVRQGPKEKKARVMALDAATGSVMWTHEMPTWHGWAAGDSIIPNHICLPDSFGNPAIGGDGSVYVGFQSGHFYAIRDRDGNGQIEPAEASSFDFSNAFQGSPGIAPGMLVATPCNGMHVWLDRAA